MAENTKDQWKERERGALWAKTSQKSGTKYLYLRVKINDVDHEFICYKNKFKSENPNAPDYRVYTKVDAPSVTKPVTRPAKPRQTRPVVPATVAVEEVENDDIDL